MRASRACKTDANQADIVAALKAIGCSVAVTSGAGDGFPDLVVGIPGANMLMEIKNPEQDKSHRALTAEQQIFHTEWRGPITVVHTVAEALGVINRLRQQMWNEPRAVDK